MGQQTKQEKNNHICIALLAHVDAGKTTLSESLLYACGALRKVGRVDHKDSFLDTDTLERERGITIFSKQARLSMQHRSVSLNQVFSEIERQTGYSFLVRNNDINTNQKISIDVKNKSVKEVLEILFAGKNIRYEVEGERISVYKPQQTRQTTISGIVVDAAQEPIIGASGKHNQRLYHGF